MTYKNRRQNHKRLVRVGKYAKRYKHINWRVIPKEPRWRQIVKAENEMRLFIENSKNKSLTVQELINQLNKIDETKVFIWTDDGYLTAVDKIADNSNS